MAKSKRAADAETVRALLSAAQVLRKRCNPLRFFDPVAHTYNPLDYAWNAHAAFLAKARSRPQVLLVGMNPGPFGMVQTGVPFGEVASVRDFLGIDERNARIIGPNRQHPKRPVEGFACRRSEVSGARVWKWARDQFGTAECFFEHAFIWNWCPLAFMSESGANLTPDKLAQAGSSTTSVARLNTACDDALAAAIHALEPSHVVGFGAFAAKRALQIVSRSESNNLSVHQVLHPSPASPAANRGWACAVNRQLAAAGIEFK